MDEKRYFVPSAFLECAQSYPYEEEFSYETRKELEIELRAYGAHVLPSSVYFGPSVTTVTYVITGKVPPYQLSNMEGVAENHFEREPIRAVIDEERGALCFELPSESRAFVELGEFIEEEIFEETKPYEYPVALGKDYIHENVVTDLKTMEHTLIAGMESAGKSTFLHNLLCGLFYKKAPWELQAIVVSPNRRDFAEYQGFPHLVTGKALSNFAEIKRAIEWLKKEVSRRYDLYVELRKQGLCIVDLDEYNALQREIADKLPRLLLVIDDFQKLMEEDKPWFERELTNLAQISLKAGVHIVIATEETTPDVLTGGLKEHFATRIAFALEGHLESKVILNRIGAEKLLGYGDYLISLAGGAIQRLQAPAISAAEVYNIETYIKEKYNCDAGKDGAAYIQNEPAPSAPAEKSSASLPKEYLKALEVVAKSGSVSISMIQRLCGIGYSRAGKIIEWMEEQNYIGPFEGRKNREVLITMDEVEMLYGYLNNADPRFVEGLEFAVDNGGVTLSLLQRRCGFAYETAKQSLEWMEGNGYVAAYNGATPRTVYLTKEEFVKKFR